MLTARLSSFMRYIKVKGQQVDALLNLQDRCLQYADEARGETLFQRQIVLVSEYDSIEGPTVKGNVLWYDGNVTAKLTYPGSRSNTVHTSTDLSPLPQKHEYNQMIPYVTISYSPGRVVNCILYVNNISMDVILIKLNVSRKKRAVELINMFNKN